MKPNEGPGGGAEIQERRRHPDRVSIGPVPTGLADAQAFYEALSNAMADDVLLSVEPAGPGALVVEADAALVSRLVRATDRVLFAGSSIKLYLADGGTDGTAVFLARLREVAPILADQVRVRSVTLATASSVRRVRPAEGLSGGPPPLKVAGRPYSGGSGRSDGPDGPSVPAVAGRMSPTSSTSSSAEPSTLR